MNQKRIDHFRRTLDSSNGWHGMTQQDLLWLPGTKVLYAACSKNACSRIKVNLANYLAWPNTYLGSPHDRTATGLVGVFSLSDPDKVETLLNDGRAFRFAFARNPFSRIVSAYLNRVANLGLESYDHSGYVVKAREDRRRKILAWKTGRDPGTVNTGDDIGFEDFIRFVCQQDAFDMDRHWYFQGRTMHVDFIEYDFIGRVENFDSDFARVMQEIPQKPNFKWCRDRLNATGGKAKRSSYRDFFSPELEKIFVERFAEDFETFGYPDRVCTSKPVRTSGQLDMGADGGGQMGGGRWGADASRSDRKPITYRWLDNDAPTKVLRDIAFVIVGARYADEVVATSRSITQHFRIMAPIVVFYEGVKTRYVAELSSTQNLDFVFGTSEDNVLFGEELEQIRQSRVFLIDAGVSLSRPRKIVNANGLFDGANSPIAVGGRMRDLFVDPSGRISDVALHSQAGFFPDKPPRGEIRTIPIGTGWGFGRHRKHGAAEKCDFVGSCVLFDRNEILEFSEHATMGWSRDRLSQLAFFRELKDSKRGPCIFFRDMEAERRIPVAERTKRYPQRPRTPAIWRGQPPRLLVETGSKEYYLDEDGDYVAFPCLTESHSTVWGKLKRRARRMWWWASCK